MAYLLEVLASVRDLRANSVATRQDVILAEHDVDSARKRLEQTKPRVEGCRKDWPIAAD